MVRDGGPRQPGSSQSTLGNETRSPLAPDAFCGRSGVSADRSASATGPAIRATQGARRRWLDARSVLNAGAPMRVDQSSARAQGRR
jgi:hypothetical protein